MFRCFINSAAGLAAVVAMVVCVGTLEEASAAMPQISASAILMPQIV